MRKQNNRSKWLSSMRVKVIPFLKQRSIESDGGHRFEDHFSSLGSSHPIVYLHFPLWPRSNIYRWRWKGASKAGFRFNFPGKTFQPPVESWNSRGRAIKGGHNCFQVVETLGPRKILSETVFQLLLSPPSLLTSRLGEISRNGEENVSNGYVSGSL